MHYRTIKKLFQLNVDYLSVYMPSQIPIVKSQIKSLSVFHNLIPILKVNEMKKPYHCILSTGKCDKYYKLHNS